MNTVGNMSHGTLVGRTFSNICNKASGQSNKINVAFF